MFGKNVRYLRGRREMSQQELADKLGYKTAVTVHKWETGENTPPVSSIIAVARIFGVSLEDITGVDLERRDADAESDLEISAAKAIPIINDVEVAGGLIVSQSPIGIFFIDDTVRADLCILMPDDSMRGAGLYEGDTVLIRRDYTPTDGGIYAIKASGALTVRVLSWHKSSLIVSRADFRASVAGDDLAIIGECVGVYHAL